MKINKFTDAERKKILTCKALDHQERSELNAYRAKAQRESDEYCRQMRGMIDSSAPMTIAEMQKAMNVNLHARELPAYHEVSTPDPIQPIVKLIFRQAFYFLLLMLAAGVGLAVFL